MQYIKFRAGVGAASSNGYSSAKMMQLRLCNKHFKNIFCYMDSILKFRFFHGVFFSAASYQGFLFPVIFHFFGLFRNRSVCFGCFDMDPNHRKEPKRTETNRKNDLLVSRNKPKNNRNRSSFGLFRFEPKKKFVCFEDTLIRAQCTESTNPLLRFRRGGRVYTKDFGSGLVRT
jgi:hypothetical protein